MLDLSESMRRLLLEPQLFSGAGLEGQQNEKTRTGRHKGRLHNKHHPAAVYCDKRREQYHNLWKNAGNCTLDINPDVVCDFTSLPFTDNSFQMVVFDPPHLTGAKETAWLVKKYGKLDESWPKMLHDGFRECMRVLKPDGVLIFKWSEYDIPAADVWKAIGQKPLFGHHSGKQSRTFWACFMKMEEMEMLEGMET